MRKFVSSKLAVALSFAFFSASAWASKPVLPDACGNDDVKFDVKALKDQPALGAPPAGKAQIVFVETKEGAVLGAGVVRYGIDGKWAGATRFGTYVAVTVEPGERHVCYSVKGSKNMLGATSVTTEAGKTYYYEFKYTYSQMHGMVSGPQGGMVVGGSAAVSFDALSEDQGKFRVKASDLAEFSSK